MRSHAIDTANGAAAWSFIVATLSGWTVQQWTALLGLVYMLLLIADKLGLLRPVRCLIYRWLTWSWRQIVAAGRLANRGRVP